MSPAGEPTQAQDGSHVGAPLGENSDQPSDELATVVQQLSEQTALRVRAELAMAAALTEVVERENALCAAEELARLGSWSWTVDAPSVTWSDQVHHIFGTDPSGPAPDYPSYVEMVHADDREHVLEVIRTALQTGSSYRVEHRVVRADGQVREIVGRGRAELDDHGVPLRLVGSIQDVTDARASAKALQHSRDLFAGVLDAATEQSIIATDPQGLITVFNTGAERMLGYTAAEMIGTSPERLHDPVEIRARALELGIAAGFDVFLTRAALGEPETRQWTYVTRDGRRLQASITVTAMRGPAGEITGYIKVGTDITAQLHTLAALQDSEMRFRDTFEHAPNGMMLIGLDGHDLGRILQANPALCRLTGFTREQLLDMSIAQLTGLDEIDAHWERLTALRDGRVSAPSVERHWVHADGHDLWVQFSVSPRTGRGDKSVVGQVEDITARKHAEARLTHQALHDGLTGLPNRLLLMERVEHALPACTRSHLRVALLYLDLDGFKSVNDTAGHAVGDQMLVEVSNRLSQAVRPGDTVARLGGDEFVVVCPEMGDAAAATNIAERILEAVRVPYIFGAHTFTLGASVGVSLSGNGLDPERMLHQADRAMYAAKHAGKSQIRIADANDPALTARSARAVRVLRIESELSHAVEHHELILHGQPVINMLTDRIVGVENLLRWQHPARGLLNPIEFLDVAELSDLMIPIERQVLNDSCRMVASWVRLLGDAAPPVHVNISGRQLEAGMLHDDVVEALQRYRLNPSQLVLELTETHMPLLADSVRNDLLELRAQGVKVAIDDLGTGFSSLTRITELPVDILKIDMTFVAGMHSQPACAAVVRGIVAIGTALGLDVIAEGVETGVQATRLLEYGCDSVQGYLYSHPLPEAELLTHLTHNLSPEYETRHRWNCPG